MSVSEMTRELRQVPRKASTLAASPVQFAAAADGEPNKVPVHMLARSPQAVTHWYWGQIAHDMAGVRFAKDRIIVDWCHLYGEVMGYLDQFTATPETGLEVSGYLISTKLDDQAADVIAKGKLGVPYESSIDFDLDSAVIEYVPEGRSSTVNGYQFAGPGYIVREWTVRRLAVCPNGIDPNATTEFKRGDAEGDVPVHVFMKGAGMSTDSKGAEAAGPQGGVDPRAQFAADLKRYVDKFGGENGGKWFAEGLTFEAALDRQNETLRGQLTAQETQFAAERTAHVELQAKFAAIGPTLGETAPVSSENAEGTPTAAGKFAGKLPDGLARFAAGIVLPK